MKAFPKEKILKDGNLLFAKWKTNSASTKQFVLMQENAFVFVLNGKKIIAQEKDIEVDNTQVLLVKKGIYKMTEYLANDGTFEALVIYFNNTFIKQSTVLEIYNSEQSSCNIDIIVLNKNKIIDSFIKQYLSYIQENENNQSILELKVTELTYLLSKQNPRAKQFFNSITQQDDNLKTIMENLYKENYSIEELAGFTNRSLSKFKRDFAKTFNCTPANWILKQRLTEAQSCLLTTDKSISEIAYQCGFSSLSQFDKSFRRYFGFTPSSFRSSIMDEIDKS